MNYKHDIDWIMLGHQFKTCREEKGMTAEFVSDRLSLTQNQIHALEMGQTRLFPGRQTRLWCAKQYAALLSIEFTTT
jgi:cytoskeletal protein RodZ